MLLTKVKNKEKSCSEGRKVDDLGFEHAELQMCGRSYFSENVLTLSRILHAVITM